LDFTSEPDHGAAQRAAIYALGQGGALSLLTGVAGAGTTTLLKPLVEGWKADTRFDAAGRDVVGLATGWKQADALKDAGIDRTLAMDPLKAIESGEFKATRNTVLVIDEISQVAPRAMLALLQLQFQRTELLGPPCHTMKQRDQYFRSAGKQSPRDSSSERVYQSLLRLTLCRRLPRPAETPRHADACRHLRLLPF
jgi:hypothetical protein